LVQVEVQVEAVTEGQVESRQDLMGVALQLILVLVAHRRLEDRQELEHITRRIQVFNTVVVPLQHLDMAVEEVMGIMEVVVA
jgi:hypothetical protein